MMKILYGHITDYKIYSNGFDMTNKKLLVIDDICDGGGTFVLLANELKKHNPTRFSLFVTHGIFSKGVEVLYDAGYSSVITTDSLFDEGRKALFLKLYGRIFPHDFHVLPLETILF